jgi:hypothetical protein
MPSVPSVPAPAGHVIATFRDQGPVKVTEVAFDGSRLAWLSTRDGSPETAAQAGELQRFGRAAGPSIVATGVAAVLAVNRRRIAVGTKGHRAALVDPDGGTLRALPAVALGTPGAFHAAPLVALEGDDLGRRKAYLGQ